MKLALVIGILFSFNAFADFTGEWTGAGTAYDSRLGQRVHKCPSVRWHVEQSADKIVIGEGSADCPIPFGWGVHEFQITSGELFFRNVKVGAITESKVHVEFIQYQEPDHIVYSVVYFDMELTAEGLKIREYEVRSSDTKTIFDFNADLVK